MPHPFLYLFFEDLLHAKVREFNPRYADAEGALPGKFRHLHTDIYGNRDFVESLRNRGKFFDHEEKRERDLILIAHELPHFAVPNHGKLWKSLMRAHLGEYEEAEKQLMTYARSAGGCSGGGD